MDFALASPTQTQTAAAPPGHPDPWAPPSLRLVCLDIDDTLVDFSASGRRALSVLLGRSDLWSLWETITDRYVAKVVAGELDYGSMHRLRSECFLAELGIDADAADFERRRLEILHSSWRLFDDVVACLEWLRAAGLYVAAVTNASGRHQRAKLATLGLAPFFDHVAIAGELGVAKPDPEMFHSVCLALGCDPAEAVHVGDKLDTDAVGAVRAGLAGVWLNRPGGETDVPTGVHVIQDLAALPELLVCEFARVGVPIPR
ncbi:HAD family hydrolase [Amycolatopsis suaedae]|uniref:HAD family hydrolase n=1 Tax=Amycolatopsis suaedae TaxID=2510978 RepID=A0A4Q7JBY4_9PSEU|nr:HAD family hydrolase [Amycolatopsis suaedae]RZQ64546.1 HAD family hydrolase [Amycolatopsis suaedae]